MEYYEFRAMNTDIVLAAKGEPGALAVGFERVRDWMAATEKQLTRFSADSELARLNRSSGDWFRASPELFEIVSEARAFSEQTDGLFDPSILDALERAGYDRSMDDIREYGAGPARLATGAPLEFEAVELRPATREIRLPYGMRIDLGGIAKGWMTEQAARQLSRFAEACAVNAGGDMFLIGAPGVDTAWPGPPPMGDRGPRWEVELEDPRSPDRPLTILQVGPGAVATSSVTRRTWQQDGRVRHHLIDPRRGRPADTDWLSVTVIAPHATVAEVFAKVLLIAGPQQAERLAARQGPMAFMAVDRDGRLWGSQEAREYVDERVEIV